MKFVRFVMFSSERELLLHKKQKNKKTKNKKQKTKNKKQKNKKTKTNKNCEQFYSQSMYQRIYHQQIKKWVKVEFLPKFEIHKEKIPAA